MEDVLAQLFAFKWRDVEIPISRMRMSLAHDLVEHKYWRVDGARVEDTGVAPVRISAEIPLLNGVQPGKNESWNPQLYPSVMRALLIAFARRETGPLQHPEFGTLTCKAENIDLDWDATKRGGCSASASWVETVDDEIAHKIVSSPASDAQGAAIELDENSTNIRSLVPDAPVFTESFESAMNRVMGAFDQVALQSSRAAGRIDAMLYRAGQLKDSVDRARGALSWPIRHNVEQLRSAALALRETLRRLDRDVVLYRVPAPTTLAGVRAQLPDAEVSMTELIRLNLPLLRGPVVPQGAVVRYYAPRIAA